LLIVQIDLLRSI